MIIWSTALEYLDNLAEHCILECPEKLVPLFARSLPNLTVKVENRAFDSDRQDFDYHIPMGSLFKCFYPEISKRKICKPFLKTDPKKGRILEISFELVGQRALLLGLVGKVR